MTNAASFDFSGAKVLVTGGSNGIVIALVIAVLLAGAIGAGVFVYKDRIFGSDAESQPSQPR